MNKEEVEQGSLKLKKEMDLGEYMLENHPSTNRALEIMGKDIVKVRVWNKSKTGPWTESPILYYHFRNGLGRISDERGRGGTER